MKIQLILTVIMFVIVFNVRSVETIKCFVCNSEEENDCNSYPLKETLLKDCYKVDEERKNMFENAIKANQMHTNKTVKPQNDFIESFGKGRVSSQCLKITMWVENKERVHRDCTGLVGCLSHTSKGGCHRGSSTDSRVKSEQCYCETDACNSSHRTLHPNNFWLNIMLPIIISLANYVFN